MVWIDVDIGEVSSDPERSSSFTARRWMEEKWKIRRRFSWGEVFPGGHGAVTLLFILCYNKGNATWVAVASKEGKDET